MMMEINIKPITWVVIGFISAILWLLLIEIFKFLSIVLTSILSLL